MGANAPVTCLARSHGTAGNGTLYAGCWDKTIHSWSLTTRKPIRRYIGHTDFVKCVTTCMIKRVEILISGSSDASIIVWDASNGKKLHVLKGHARGVLCLTVDPTSVNAATGSSEEVTLFSGDSTREIRRWRISLESAREDPTEPILAHETSVNRIHFDEGEEDLWTASSDNTIKHLVRSRGWEADSSFKHPDFVRDVLPFMSHVVTACRDEEVRVWNASSEKVVCTYSGHYDEVTGLALTTRAKEDKSLEPVVVSVSIDGTIRTWSLDPQEIKTYNHREQEEAARLASEVNVDGAADAPVMTAEEEAELAELMDDDESE